MINHTEGCAVVRTTRCTCAYLAQWDENSPVLPPLGSRNKEDTVTRTPLEESARILDQAIRLAQPLGHKSYCMDESYPECTCHLDIFDYICCHRTTGWHRADNISCEDWDALVKHTREDKGEEYIKNGYGHSDDIHPKHELEQLNRPLGSRNKEDIAPIFPMEEKDYYPQINKQGLKALTVNGEVWVPRDREEGRTPGDEAAFDMWKNKALNAEAQAKGWKKMALWFALMAAVMAVVGIIEITGVFK